MTKRFSKSFMKHMELKRTIIIMDAVSAAPNCVIVSRISGLGAPSLVTRGQDPGE